MLFRSEDIQIISFIFSARRSKKNDTRCDNEDTNGCKEIFIVESINDGWNWSKPIMAPRGNMHDEIHRHSPSMVYDRESGTIYIVYTITPKDGPSTIGLIKKKVGATTYDKEMVLNLDNIYSWSQPKITVTNPEKKMTVLHLSILGSKTDHFSVFYTRAVNNTDKWESVKDLADGKSSKHFNAISAVGMAGVNDLYLAYTSDKQSFLRISENNGEVWSEPYTINKDAGIVPFMRACGQTKTLGALISIYSENNFNDYGFYYYNRTSKTLGSFVTPFKDLKSTRHIPMFDCTGLSEETLSYTAVAGFEYSIVFAEYNYNYPELKTKTD